MFLMPFLKGLGAGLLVAFPVGPIGILCLRRMLSQGALIGIASGIGGATADVIYATVALLGLSAVYSFLVAHFAFVRVLSSIFFAVLGINILLSSPTPLKKTWTQGVMQAYLSTLVLTLANPLLILSFIAFFTLVGITGQEGTLLDVIAMLTGIFVGSSTWWIVGGIITSLMHYTLKPSIMRTINLISGLFIVAFSLVMVMSLLFR